jgi:tetratricopeptide (TPR) repeat protein
VLAATVGYRGQTEETIRLTNESAALPGGDPLALYDQSRHLFFGGRIAEAEAALQRSIAQQDFGSALLLDVWYKTVLHADLSGAQSVLRRIAPSLLQEDRAAYFAYFVSLLQRDTEGALARLRTAPRDWISDYFYNGPKSLLAGNALQMAGRTEAAVIEWQTALKLVEQRLAIQPNDRPLLANRMVLLAHLADREKATQAFTVFTQVIGGDPTKALENRAWVARPLTQAHILLGRQADAIALIRSVLKQQVHVMMDYSAATLRLDPMFDPLRGEPEFQRLLAETQGDAQALSALRSQPTVAPESGSVR